jgi:hypothetical protein
VRKARLRRLHFNNAILKGRTINMPIKLAISGPAQSAALFNAVDW